MTWTIPVTLSEDVGAHQRTEEIRFECLDPGFEQSHVVGGAWPAIEAQHDAMDTYPRTEQGAGGSKDLRSGRLMEIAWGNLF